MFLIFTNIIAIIFGLCIVAVFIQFVVSAIRRRKTKMLMWVITYMCLFAGIGVFVHIAMKESFLATFVTSTMGIPVPQTIIGFLSWHDIDSVRPMIVILWVLADMFAVYTLTIHINTSSKATIQNECAVFTTKQSDILYAKSNTTLFCS